MSKSPEMQKMVDGLSESVFGISISNAKTNGTCVTCGNTAEEFRDELSRKEYRISGMCQRCQDKVFG